MTRNELVEEISKKREEAKRSGPIHRRDLWKHIHRMERELRDYDRFQAEAKQRRCG
ncbi:MAG: hypothetical protein J6S60_04615 [Oscillospiraceae bacterium]|nr:hypothetical protein [Oscillospiraceae bacterium]